MKSQRNIARELFGLTLTLVGLMSWTTLPIHLPERAVQAATRARATEPTGQAVSRAVANGRIAFVSSEGNERADIYTMNPDGSNVQRLTNNSAYDQGPKWSPDGTRIAFTSSRDDTSVGCASGGGCTHEIYVMNADGTNQTRTNSPGFDDTFDWSPDSTRIVFQSFHDGSVNISVMNADGSNVQRLTNYPGYDFPPKWSPDGTKIAFVRTDDWFDGPYNISVMNADGTNQTRFSVGGDDPRWSPDGTRIVFVGWFASSNEICVMNADGSNVQRLTDNRAYDSTPKWSPDGSKITFISCGDSNGSGCSNTPRLWVVNDDGSNPTKLTDTPAWWDAWSPDGTKIIFGNAQDNGTTDLFVMNPDGSGLTNITNTPGKNEGSPSWQPISSSPCPNPIDCADFFVRQHYRDFLNREPDPAGLAFWTNEITSCGFDAQCIEVKRINVSAAFFLSIEFQNTGYLVERIYKAAYGDALDASTGLGVPMVRRTELTADSALIGQGVVVLAPGWEQQLETNKRAYALAFVQRPRFTDVYPHTLTPTEFVARLNQNTGGVLTQAESDALVVELIAEGTAATRADVLRRVAENATLERRERNRAFILMQYFGYLRRQPDAAPDINFAGYHFWLAKLDQFGGDFVQAEMVKAFIMSGEYRQRFGH